MKNKITILFALFNFLMVSKAMAQPESWGSAPPVDMFNATEVLLYNVPQSICPGGSYTLTAKLTNVYFGYTKVYTDITSCAQGWNWYVVSGTNTTPVPANFDTYPNNYLVSGSGSTNTVYIPPFAGTYTIIAAPKAINCTTPTATPARSGVIYKTWDFNVPGTQTINYGNSITLTASSSKSLTYKWSSNSTNGPSTTVAPLINTNYSVKATDQCGYSKTKTVTVNVANGPISNALSFDGVNDYVTAPKYADLATGNSNFTIEARIKANSTQNVTYPSIFSTRTEYEEGILLFLGVGSGTGYGGRPWFQINGDNHICTSCPSVTDNNVHHVAATRSGDTISIYVDGVRYYTRMIYPGYGNVSVTGNVRIGHDFGNATDTYFKGEIAEVRFYGYAKTKGEVLANKDKTAFSPNTLGYWRLNEGTGQFTNNNSSASYQYFQSQATLGSTSAADDNDPVWKTNTATGILKYQGSSFENPIPLGSISQNTTRNVTTNNQTANFDDDFEYESSGQNNDVFYTLTLPQTSRLNFYDCPINFPHHFVIYNVNRKKVAELYSEPDDCGKAVDILAGTYYILVEGTQPWPEAPSSGPISFDINPTASIYTPVGKMAADSESDDINTADNIHVSPNPIQSGALNFGRMVNEYVLSNSNGQIVKEGKNASELNIDGLNAGIYILNLDGKVEKIVVE